MGHPVIAGLLMLFVGTVLAADGVRRWDQARASLAWPKVRGEILNARITESKGRHRYYPVHIRYRYEVAGQSFESERIAFDRVAPGDSLEAGAILRHYTSLPWLDVYHDPARPGEAVLQVGAAGTSLPIALVGVVLAGIGLSQILPHA
jgi:hypothetical protein